MSVGSPSRVYDLFKEVFIAPRKFLTICQLLCYNNYESNKSTKNWQSSATRSRDQEETQTRKAKAAQGERQRARLCGLVRKQELYFRAGGQELMVFRCLTVLLSLLLLPIISVSSHAPCLTTLPSNPQFVPPAPYPTDASDGFWYGSDVLWTRLPFSGDWATAGKMGQKLFVWSRGYDWRTARQPQLIVTGKRLEVTRHRLQLQVEPMLASAACMQC